MSKLDDKKAVSLRFKKSGLDERQIRTFKEMHMNHEYSVKDICERFGFSSSVYQNVVKELGLTPRSRRT